MLFDRQQILGLIEQAVGPQQAQQAADQLPEQVDHEEHGGLLQRFGLDPRRLLGDFQQPDSGYQQEPGYQQRDSGYQQEPGYQQRDSGYHERDSGYEGGRDSGYQQEPGYEQRDSGYEGGRDSGYEGGPEAYGRDRDD